MKFLNTILCTALALAGCCACTPSDPLVVRTESGLVKGIEEEGTLAFKGIPYAKVERFMPPLPVDKWDTVMVCDHFGPQVMQGNGRREMPESVMSEKNSCVLNVWTTDTKARKPVMLWIHGGGFDSGSAAGNPGYGLARQDVVVVSLNHRLNILGFLDLSSFGEKYRHSGMVGMLDIVQALEWIRDNIKAFGGDPSNVTIFGESGGGGKVGTLMCMPAAKGLFHKAIIMSGTILNVNTKAMAQELGRAVVEQLGIGPDELERLADVPYGELVAAGQRAMAASIGTRAPGTPMMWGFGPAPDGEVLLQQPFQPDFADISSDVPLMIGTTFNELQRRVYGTPMTLDEAKAQPGGRVCGRLCRGLAGLHAPGPPVRGHDVPAQDPDHRRRRGHHPQGPDLDVHVHLEIPRGPGFRARLRTEFLLQHAGAPRPGAPRAFRGRPAPGGEHEPQLGQFRHQGRPQRGRPSGMEALHAGERNLLHFRP